MGISTLHAFNVSDGAVLWWYKGADLRDLPLHVALYTNSSKWWLFYGPPAWQFHHNSPPSLYLITELSLWPGSPALLSFFYACHGPQFRKEIRMVGNRGPITGCLIHIVTKYRGYKDACVRNYFPVLPFHRELYHNSNRIKLGILHFYCWLQHKRWQSNENVINLNMHDG